VRSSRLRPTLKTALKATLEISTLQVSTLLHRRSPLRTGTLRRCLTQIEG